MIPDSKREMYRISGWSEPPEGEYIRGRRDGFLCGCWVASAIWAAWTLVLVPLVLMSR